MKYLLTLLIPLLLNADYNIFYKNDNIADMKNLNTLYKGYLKGDLNFKARLATGLNKLVFYEKGFKPKIKNAKYMEDKAGILSLGRMIQSFQINKPIMIDNPKQFLLIKCKYKNKKTYECKFSRQNKEDLMIYKGKIIVKNGEVESICENRTEVCLKKAQK